MLEVQIPTKTTKGRFPNEQTVGRGLITRIMVRELCCSAKTYFSIRFKGRLRRLATCALLSMTVMILPWPKPKESSSAIRFTTLKYNEYKTLVVRMGAPFDLFDAWPVSILSHGLGDPTLSHTGRLDAPRSDYTSFCLEFGNLGSGGDRRPPRAIVARQHSFIYILHVPGTLTFISGAIPKSRSGDLHPTHLEWL